MPYLSRHGTMKPPLGAQIDPTHPFVRGHLLSVLFNDSGNALPTVLWGSVVPRTLSLISPSSISWASNREGAALRFADQDARLNLGLDFTSNTPLTMTVVRRKTDTTLRNGVVFGTTSGVDTARCIAHVPHTDGKVYWYFGGSGDSAPNLLTVSGLSFSTTIPERWVFTAGPQGSSIWQNGVKVASQSTALTKTYGGSLFYLNWNGGASSHGDLQDINFFAAYDYQWNDALCQWWSAEPYDHLYAPPMTYPGPSSSALVGATAGESSVVTPSGKRSGFGSQKPSRRLHGRRH